MASGVLPDGINRWNVMDKLMLAGITPETPDPLRNTDLSYFHHWLPNVISHDAALQSRIDRTWEKIVMQIDTSQEKAINISVEGNSLRLFQLLLKTEHRVERVIVDGPEKLQVILKDQDSSSATARLSCTFHHRLLTIPLDSSLSLVRSSSSRFVNPSLLCNTSGYLDFLQEISSKIKDAVLNKRHHIFIPCLGFDRLFLKRALCQLYPTLIRIAFPEASSLRGGLYLGIKTDAKISDAVLETMGKVRTQATLFRSPQSISEQPTSSSAEPSTVCRLARMNQHITQLGLEASMNRTLSIECALFAAYLSSIIQNELQGNIPSEDDMDQWYATWIELYRTPIFLRSLAAETQQYLNDLKRPITTKEMEWLMVMSSATDLKQFRAAFKGLSDDLAENLQMKLDKSCRFFEVRLYFDFNDQNLFMSQKIIKNFALLKCGIEMTTFHLKKPISIADLNRIEMEHVHHSYFPSKSPTPLVSVRINGRPFEIDPSEKGSKPMPLLYYQRLVETLYFLATGREIDEASHAVAIVANQEFEDPFPSCLALMLRAGSSPSQDFFDADLREHIVFPLLELDYSITLQQPQENPTCEFFVARNQDFTTISTAIYEINKDGIKKGEFVAKWIISLKDGHLLSEIKIPMIDIIDAADTGEQELIYKGFSFSGNYSSKTIVESGGTAIVR